jgi:hypothetical protein
MLDPVGSYSVVGFGRGVAARGRTDYLGEVGSWGKAAATILAAALLGWMGRIVP